LNRAVWRGPGDGKALVVTLVLVVLVVLVAGGAGALVADRSGGDARSGPPAAAGPRSEPPASPEPDTSGGGHGGGHGDGEPVVPPEVDVDTVAVEGARTVRAEPDVVDGVKVFTLNAEPVQWELVPGRSVTAWGYNGQVPGPELWVDEGDRVRVEFTNDLPVATTIHWHGIAVPNEMDGVPGVTQDPIEPGARFVYEFEAKPSGTFWYHSHLDSVRQLDMGLSGAFVIKGADEPAYDRDYVQLLDEWVRLENGRNGWEGVTHAGHNLAEYNWFTINGKSFPATEDMVVAEGDRVRIRIINAGYQSHPMHLHGKRFTVVAKDGAPVPAPYQADTVLVGSGERYDLELVADDPGDWMFHCHILHHVTNDAVEDPGGLMNFVTYEGHDNAYQKRKAAREEPR
jgi:FtsP/CotA-like multicopper oxidase with cupredoxin domain